MPVKNWEYVATPTGAYRYSINSTGDSSHKYGNCYCGQHATEVFIQVEERQFYDFVTRKLTNPDDPNWFDDFLESPATYTGSEADRGWTQNKCRTLMGHYNCLLAKRYKREALLTIAAQSGGGSPIE
ncbi:MAG: hypothetical protein L0226_17900 [Acidobacteria bacterium]|nr:hypothetical protein [Acidobacteriota bacterium]